MIERACGPLALGVRREFSRACHYLTDHEHSCPRGHHGCFAEPSLVCQIMTCSSVLTEYFGLQGRIVRIAVIFSVALFSFHVST